MVLPASCGFMHAGCPLGLCAQFILMQGRAMMKASVTEYLVIDDSWELCDVGCCCSN